MNYKDPEEELDRKVRDLFNEISILVNGEYKDKSSFDRHYLISIGDKTVKLKLEVQKDE